MPRRKKKHVAMRLSGHVTGKTQLEFDEGDVKAVADVVADRVPLKVLTNRLLSTEGFMELVSGALVRALDHPQLGPRLMLAIKNRTAADAGDPTEG